MRVPRIGLVGLPAAAALAAVVVAIGSGACGMPSSTTADGSRWVGSITTDGNVTTVVNESGSVWGGTAGLVEELSIGVDAGEAAYMFGRVAGLAATMDRIYVLDASIPTVRVFDAAGRYLRDIGREGGGPGEFRRPSDIKIDAGADRLYVRDYGQDRITVFDLEGELIDTWPLEGGYSTILPMVLGVDGRLYTQTVLRGESRGERRTGMVPYAPDGVAGEALVEPFMTVDAPMLPPVVGSGVRFEGSVPFAPRYLWTMSRTLQQVAGTSDRYRLELRGPDATTVIERRLDPVPLGAEEAAWHKRARIAINRGLDEDWGWGSAAMPDRKPYFEELYADLDGRIWVRRLGPGFHTGECDEHPEPGPVSRIRDCWRDATIFDVFGADGRFLGEVDLPQALRFTSKPWIIGDDVLLVQEDDAGTIVVKRYRLSPPADDP